jgi:hypothetical protein
MSLKFIYLLSNRHCSNQDDHYEQKTSQSQKLGRNLILIFFFVENLNKFERFFFDKNDLTQYFGEVFRFG